MKILVLYATLEGQTEKIAHFLETEISKAGHTVVLVNADDATDIPFQDVDAVIAAASVHQRRHPKTFEATLLAHADQLKARKTMFISVSLNAAFPDGVPEAKEYATEMKMRTKFTPDAQMLVGGALQTSKYDYFATQVIQHVILRGKDFDPSVGEHEFTDWQALKTGVMDFLGTVTPSQDNTASA